MTTSAEILRGLLGSLTYKPGWCFKVGGPGGRSLCIHATTPDSNNPARSRTTQHMFTIPDDLEDPQRWVFDRLLDAERHEVGEFYAIDGFRPFFPYHQDEGSPYVVVDRREIT